MYYVSIRLGKFERELKKRKDREIAVKFAHYYANKKNVPVYVKHAKKGTLSIFYPKKGDA